MTDKVYIDLKTGKPMAKPGAEGAVQSTITIKSGDIVITPKSPNLKVVK